MPRYRPPRRSQSPPPLPRWRKAWREMDNVKPEISSGGVASPLIALPQAFDEIHASFNAPFGSPEWQALVNWRRVEAERGHLKFGDDRHLEQYLHWAEDYARKMYDPMPQFGQQLQATDPFDILPPMPYGLYSVHNSIPAPFNSAEWHRLVQWKERQNDCGMLPLEESQRLRAYLAWARRT
jgi:hypothetical protein